MTTVQCIRCERFSLREAGAMAKQGYGHCALEPNRATFQSATFVRHCDTFERLDSDVADKRIAWLAWEKKRFMKEVLSHDET